MSTMVVCSSILCEKIVYVFSKTSNGHNFCSGYPNRELNLYQFGIKLNFLCNAFCGSV